jgi:phosphatidylglycerophosphate synthase
MTQDARRPLNSRNQAWAQWIAGFLIQKKVSANVISAMSLVCAAIAGAAFFLHDKGGEINKIAYLITAVIGIQARLLCNLFDGMVAVGSGKSTPTGELWNELPDRFADVLIIVGLGYGLHKFPYAIDMAWAAAVIAVLTAYVRALGQVTGAPAAFHGPMAKPHRMALLTGAAIMSAILASLSWSMWILPTALGIIVLGGLITLFRRLSFIVASLRRP